MRGLTLDAVRCVTYSDDIDEPVLAGPTDALVAVTAAGLCGSDLHPYEGREATRFGIVPGHEIVGSVVEVGAACSLRPGERVLAAFTTSCGSCRFCVDGLSARCERGELFGYGPPGSDAAPLHGGQAERVRVPLANTTLVRVPPGIDDAAALLLTDNFPTAWYAVGRAEVRAGDKVAVVGLGAVGLCAVTAAFAAGAAEVVAVDLVDDRRERAAAIGARALHPEAAAGELGSCDGVVEAAGTADAQRLAFALARPGGTLSIIAVQTTETFAFTPIEAYDRNITVRTGRAPVRSLLDDLLPRVGAAALRMPTELVVTHPGVRLEDGPETYRQFSAREGGLIKAVFAP